MHRGLKGPFNAFSKDIFFKKDLFGLKLAGELKFYAWIIMYSQVSIKRAACLTAYIGM